ncbi:MAG: ribokinase, partial [Opitutaceae bacterium]|nr:ribokinase [Opitutaceae bacterium]
MAGFDVIACGLNVVDNVVVLPATVRRNEKHQVPRMLIQGGGPGANQACGLAALGWRTAMLTRHGDNTASRIAEAEFARHGVALDLVVHGPKARPALAVVEVDPSSGERTVFYNVDDYDWLSADDVPEAAVKRAKLVITDGYEAAAALRLLELARANGIPGVLDIETGETDKVRPLYAAASHVIVSLERGRRTTGCGKPCDVIAALAEWTDA